MAHPMSEVTYHETAPEDRIPVYQKVMYGLGALGNQLLPAAIGNMAIILNIGLGMNPAVIASILAIPRFFDAIIDPVMGYITDRTKSQWGRRKPYIFAGALLAGLCFALMWQLPAGHRQNFYIWFFTIGSIVFYGAYTVFAAPFIALGYEMTPDYHERTSVMAYSNSIGNMTWVIAPWFYWAMMNQSWFADGVQGARTLAIAVGASFAIVGILPAIFVKERFYEIAQAADRTEAPARTTFHEAVAKFTDFFKGIFITLKNMEFLKLCGATFAVFNGFMMIAGLGSYVIIYYVFGGPDKQILVEPTSWLHRYLGTLSSGAFIGLFGSISALATSFVATPIITWISKILGKRKAFYAAMCIAIAGYIIKWFCYQPGRPWLVLLAAPLVSFSLGGLFTLVPSMMADLCDLDELQNGQRREGMFGAVYWWMIKMGMAVALLLSGFIMNWTGFDVALKDLQPPRSMFLMRGYEIGVSVVTMLIAILIIRMFSVTAEKAKEVRLELEKRRGKVA
jgi:GPH family glycoside/pentoside/hexuronide:cation symporter